ncbi:hypothetical protein JW960_10510 [candidate division KSB1 bacterium]|nr:hypothetical protein [candidate division KSB1 bacterium]
MWKLIRAELLYNIIFVIVAAVLCGVFAIFALVPHPDNFNGFIGLTFGFFYTVVFVFCMRGIGEKHDRLQRLLPVPVHTIARQWIVTIILFQSAISLLWIIVYLQYGDFNLILSILIITVMMPGLFMLLRIFHDLKYYQRKYAIWRWWIIALMIASFALVRTIHFEQGVLWISRLSFHSPIRSVIGATGALLLLWLLSQANLWIFEKRLTYLE